MGIPYCIHLICSLHQSKLQNVQNHVTPDESKTPLPVGEFYTIRVDSMVTSIGQLRAFLPNIFADIHVVVHLFKREDRPGFALVQPGGGANSIELSSFYLISFYIPGDP